MLTENRKKAYLTLENGAVFEGYAIGAETESVGELVFTTGMTGYIETLTDPSYGGQIVIQTFPLIGNYGMIEEDFEGKTAVNGYIVREICSDPSNFRCEYMLENFLKKNNICGICGIDTRELTRTIRDQGVMNAKISFNPPANIDEIKTYKITDIVNQVSCKEIKTYEPDGEVKYSVVLIDYGAKANIIRSLTNRGCNVTVVPSSTPAEKIIELNPDGIMLSNGPGDPKENVFCIDQIKKLIGKYPVFGICLGHQLTALAMGGDTKKLKYGHRGANQPVREVNGTRTFITSQNHGYAVIADSLDKIGIQSYINANDGSCEGIDYPDKNCFTVQFHPEGCCGPQDTGFLFDRFTDMLGGKENAEG